MTLRLPALVIALLFIGTPVFAKGVPGPKVVTVKKAAWEKAVERNRKADPAKGEAKARLQMTDNKPVGFELYRVDVPSLYHTMGLKKGDVVTVVDGTAVDNSQKFKESIDRVKGKSAFQIEVLRHKKPLTLDVRVQ